MDNVSIDFYSKSEAAVTISWPKGLPENVEIYMDSLLFGCFLIRQMRNLGNHPSNLALMHEINNWTPKVTSNIESQLGWTVYPEVAHDKHIIFHAGIAIGIEPTRAQQLYGQELLLVPFHGKGSKRFRGILTVGSGRPVFILKVSGFGFFGWNIPLFATDSIFHFLVSICKKYPMDQRIPSILINIAKGCVYSYQNHEVNVQNQELIAQKHVNCFLDQKLKDQIW